MALRDAVTLGSTAHSSSGGTTTATDAYDNDFSTSYGYEETHTGEGDYTIARTVISEHTFASARTIVQIRYRLYAKMTYTNLGSGSMTLKIEVNQGSGYITVFSQSAGVATVDTGAVTNDTGWTGVTAIKATITGSVATDRDSSLSYQVYEVQAFYTIKKCYAGVI